MRQIFKILLNIALIGLPELYKWLLKKQDKVITDKVRAIADEHAANVDPNAITDIIKK